MQGLPDHTHMPTLELLPRETPIIANPDAAKKIKPLGFKNVTVLDHEQTVPVSKQCSDSSLPTDAMEACNLARVCWFDGASADMYDCWHCALPKHPSSPCTLL
jgi:hypothetical protein